jgi:aminopeptidase N
MPRPSAPKKTLTKTKAPQPKPVRLADYRVPDFLVDKVALDFVINDPAANKEATRVTASMQLRRNPASKNKSAALVLDGEAQKLISVTLDGKKLTAKDYTLTDHHLTIHKIPAAAKLVIVSDNEPDKNTSLSGLYRSGTMLSTQCEAEGFRRITYYPDRPDVLARFTVRIEADAKKYPVLLSNGNLVAQGKKGARHWVQWQDPHPKPCYLFALVAGKLNKVSDQFVTKSKRKVLLEIYVEPGHEDQTAIALQALKDSMRWDERAYGLEYDLDRFMIVATSFFNMGAMENKGLNIFNSDCVLARPNIATDADIAFVERVVGHEYFHNWTGNRITCRDWFQLSLKEGLTVFREQQFVAAQHSNDLERVRAVRALRSRQFAEDSGPTAHPVRPDSYLTIDNFYTATVYEKGSEVCRMLHSFLGTDGFQRGMKLYVKRHDGMAATCEDFVAAMADANKFDARQFMHWYAQAGTPRLDVTSNYNAKQKTFTLEVKQSCPPTPGQPKKRAFHMPLAIGLLDKAGRDLIGTKILSVRAPVESFTFNNIAAKPVLSLLRNFSAPVRLSYRYTDEELLFLLARDTDMFSRYEAGQILFRRTLQWALAATQKKQPVKTDPRFIKALQTVLRDQKLDASFTALLLSLPSEHEMGLELAANGVLIDPDAVHAARDAVRRQIAVALRDDWHARHQHLRPDPEKFDGKTQGVRSLKNLCLGYLMAADELAYVGAVIGQLRRSSNMTDQMAALSLLASSQRSERTGALAQFYKKWQREDLVMHKWLGVQAGAQRQDTVKTVAALRQHPVFDRKNPNTVRALIGSFAHGNQWRFHAADGSGYRLLAAEVKAIDKLNPQAAARLALAFERWRDFEPKRQKLMARELQSLRTSKGLSRNVFEIIDKTLAAKPRR